MSGFRAAILRPQRFEQLQRLNDVRNDAMRFGSISWLLQSLAQGSPHGVDTGGITYYFLWNGVTLSVFPGVITSPLERVMVGLPAWTPSRGE